MSKQIPIFIRFAGHNFGGMWWLVMLPGLCLIGLAIAILIVPELLAYMVAGLVFFAGLALVGFSLRLRQVQKTLSKQARTQADTIIYQRTVDGE